MLRSISFLLFAIVQTPVTVSAQPGEQRLVSSEAEESVVQSARLPRDRHQQALLTSARRQLKTGDFTAAIDTLQQILNDDKDSFVQFCSEQTDPESIDFHPIQIGFDSG